MALKNALHDFDRSLHRLKEAYLKAKKSNDDNYNFFRDSAIQRFEFTVEIFWKSIKYYLKEIEGIECRSPKSCIREFFITGGLDSEEGVVLLLEMIDDRNMTSHTYKEEIAKMIFSKIEIYIDRLNEILVKFKSVVNITI